MQVKSLFIYSICLITLQLFSQSKPNANHEKIATAFENYFKLDRENIHLHLNKNTYQTNEEIRFKGYVIEKKYKPTLQTTNVYVSLIDQTGNKISTQLYYAEDGIFEGRIKLNKKFTSGKYYLQVYTNYMNNFLEDESSVYHISILNNSDKSYNAAKFINYESVTVSFYPESGIFLSGATNTLGVFAGDCNNRGIAITNGKIQDQAGNIITDFHTDQFGYGKFEISDTSNELYKAVFLVNGKTKEVLLPQAVSKGITFSAINYILPDKTLIKLKTNKSTLNEIKDAIFTLTFQHDETVNFIDFSFKENTEHVFTIPNTAFSEGINTISLIDQNLKKIGERIVYKPFKNSSETLINIVKKKNDSITITGSCPIKMSNISISVLPSRTISENPEKSIIAALQFDNYLIGKSENLNYYLTNSSRKKQFELDTYLLSKKSKYQWDNVLNKIPQNKYDWDIGLTIKGTINSEIKNYKELTINLNSLALGLNEFAPLNDKNEFFFEHVLAQDSTKLFFMAVDKKIKKPGIKVYSQLLNNNRIFMKSFETVSKNCSSSSDKEQVILFPKVENAILLDSINIQAKKNKLVNNKKMGNMNSRGYKISDADIANYRDILHFIRNNGFSVTVRDNNTFINSYSGNYPIIRNTPTNVDPQPHLNGPAVYIDEAYIQNYDLLRDYSLATIDEIYINKSSDDVTVRGSKGIIKIYSKKNYGAPKSASDKSPALLVKNGFQAYLPFENPKYDTVTDEGFLKLGTIDWKPFVATDENGTFHFSIPNLYQKSVYFIVEGINADGQMLSNTVLVDIP